MTTNAMNGTELALLAQRGVIGFRVAERKRPGRKPKPKPPKAPRKNASRWPDRAAYWRHWRALHPERAREICRAAYRRWRQANRELARARAREGMRKLRQRRLKETRETHGRGRGRS